MNVKHLERVDLHQGHKRRVPKQYLHLGKEGEASCLEIFRKNI